MANSFLLDEHVFRDVWLFLVTQGVDVLSAAEAGLLGQDDAAVHSYALEHGRILITLDQDFLSVLRYPVGPGRIILRVKTQTAQEMISLLQRVIFRESLEGKVWLVTPRQISSWESEP